MGKRARTPRAGSPPPPAAPSPAARPGVPVAPSARWRRAGWAAVAVGAFAALAVGAWYLRPAVRTVAGTSLGALRVGTPDDLNLVVVTLDTTRADHLGAYGSKDVRTPFFDRLAAEGALFEQAMAVAPLTLPAHSSIFTGRFPPEHGVRDNGGFFLSPDQVTLAEVLKARGFRTGGFIAAYVLDRKWGMDQGFETYFDDFELSKVRGAKSVGNIQRPGNEVVDKALPWIDSVKSERFFAWVHLYDPHTPYAPPEPYLTEYAGHPYRGEVAFTDAQVGRIVAFLEERGLLDRTVIAVMGDHGESLGEHGEETHGFFIYEGATRVPFVIRAPYALTKARRVADPVRAVDLMPTVLDLLAVPAPQGMSGVSLVPLMAGAKKELGLEGYAEAMYPLHHYGWSDLRAIRSGRYKLIDAPRPELYDLERDPREEHNLFAERRPLGDRMTARLREQENAFEKVVAQAPAEDVDPEVRARLAALGYVGTFVASTTEARTDRADPKDKIAVFNLMSTARDSTQEEGSLEKSMALLQRVLEEDPNVIDAWVMLGNQHQRLQRHREALGFYRRALELKPDYDLAVINLAGAYRALGDEDAAIAGFQRYLELNPKDAYVRYSMGELYLDRGDLARAEREFNQALTANSSVAPAKVALGVIAYRRGDLSAAEGLTREALAMKPDVRLARYNLALVAEARGDTASAERHYLEELEQHPDSYRAAFNLSRLYERMGERQLQIDALKMSIDGNPRFAEGHVYLAKALVDSGGNLNEAVGLARKGLELNPGAEVAPLGHYVLADIYNRKGRRQEADRELALGRAAEAAQRGGVKQRGG